MNHYLKKLITIKLSPVLGGRVKNMEQIRNTLTERQNIILRGADPITKGGFAQVPVVILQDRRINASAKLVYAMMLYYAWNKNHCFPGQERLAKDIGKTRVSINTAIKNLERNGILEIRRRGQGKTNIYILYITPKKK
jgi:hypothetical protein